MNKKIGEVCQDHNFSVFLFYYKWRMVVSNGMLIYCVTRVFLTSGGSESTDSAVKLSRQYQILSGHPDRWKVIGRDVSYHGTTLGALSVGASK